MIKYDSMNIYDVINDIYERKILLPAIQRKFVWEKERIEQLFDSMMKEYPIGTFLFWYLKKEATKDYKFYEFHNDYDERDNNNSLITGGYSHPEIIGVLDGQQRLSSIYLGIKGTYTYRKKYSSVDNPEAYQKSELYINLYCLPYRTETKNDIQVINVDFDKEFEFRFLRKDEVKNSQSKLWFKVNNIYRNGQKNQVLGHINKLKEYAKEQDSLEVFIKNENFINQCLHKLDDLIYSDLAITFYKESKQELDEVLDIFIRVNSGGKVLSKTDLLFSTIIATWSDGRTIIEEFIKDINNLGDGFSFDNDFIMRCCLVLLDLQVLFKVKSFNTKNVDKIVNEWSDISSAIRTTVDLLNEFGFNGKLLTSQNAVIIICYHIYKKGKIDDISKENIRKYLLHALLKNIYGGQGDQVISKLREELVNEQKNNEGYKIFTLKSEVFPFENLLTTKLPSNKDLKITEDDINDFLEYKKSSNTFFVLSLLYPYLKYSQKSFHQDHIHPNSKFNVVYYKEKNIPDQNWESWTKIKDTLPNLMMLEGRTNESKGNTDFKIWFEKNYDTPLKISDFKSHNYIPEDEDLDFSNFENFYEERKTILREKLITILKI